MTAFPGRADIADVRNGWNRDGRPPSIAIVEAIAAIENTDPMDLDFVLNDFVDLDALDRLFLNDKAGDLNVELRVRDVLVTVRADGSLAVRTPDGPETGRSPAESATASQLP